MHRIPSSGRRRYGAHGYVLLSLLLVMALLVIAAGVGASRIAFQIRRDREEELIHRGVQYTRAIREYSKKTGRFPMRLEELDNVNGMRFLRKHYKDPMTGTDFKLVYMSEVVTSGPSPALSINFNGAPNSPGSPRNGSNDPGTPPAPKDPSQVVESGFSSDAQNTSNHVSDTSSRSNRLHPAGMIVGVVSGSKDQTIREFSGKNHYDQWRFYYDPAFDKFALMNAPTIKRNLLPAPKLEGSKAVDQTSSQASQPASNQPATYQ